MYYSREDEKAMFYTYGILGVVIGIAIYFCTQYNEKQVGHKLAVDGVSVYCNIDSVYEEPTGRQPIPHTLLSYNYQGSKHQLDIVFDAKWVPKGDTVILRRLTNNDAPSFMKVIGFRHQGVNIMR
ncbi:hypothetical protein [Mucilaginibacter pedocola]|uniref:Uncharacterized protein n=1 Tax=Mucilaginibacter pedocola TaxID=1792845 RepID=A0A1S9PFA0_9SPHI|nr:hypothetical protein [Mucilaginibacter pedocola]OOQ59626.1 hypothetical protein BC343_05530 [Mucilaginibacter pedocola]